MSAQDDWVKENLDILREMQLSGMTVEEKVAWQNKITDVKQRYDAARAIENDEKRTAEERKRAKDVGDAIAKAAPAITKSVISAVKAFQKGDAINGAADILDICASLAPLISTFLNAAGPEGALIGALVSVIGQILRCFGPKEESDVAKLQKFLTELEAQSELRDIKAVHDAALAYARTLMKQSASLRTLLAKPLRNHDDYRTFYVGLKQTAIILDALDPHSSVAAFQSWKVLQYLKSPEKQDVALWPTVLGVFCKTYSDLVSTTMTITAMANTDDMRARLDDVDPATSRLTETDRHALENSLLDILAYAGARQEEYESCNELVLGTLNALKTPAQRWGLHGSIWKNYALKFVSGPKNVKVGDWKDVSDRNYYHQLMLIPDAATTITKGQVSAQFNFKPAYHCFVLKSTGTQYPGSSHWVDHLWVRSETRDVDNARDVLNGFKPAFTDIWAAGETDKGLEVYAGTAEGTGAPGSVMSWTLDSKDGYNNTSLLDRVNWWPQTRSAVGSIRTVTAPVALSDDPDHAAIPPGWPDRILYASMRGSTDIYVNTGNKDYYIPGPPGWGPCTGVAVDENYLWLYQPYGFAVVSHASVMSHLRGTRQGPRWLLYPSLGEKLLGDVKQWEQRPNDRISYNGARVNTMPPLLGLISLSPCEDGTLLAAVLNRKTVRTPVPYQYASYNITDTSTIQTASYEIDVATGSVKVGEWTQIPGEARRVQKLPMPGWVLLSSLIAKLTVPAEVSRADDSVAAMIDRLRPAEEPTYAK
jgi:hypothetical protein